MTQEEAYKQGQLDKHYGRPPANTQNRPPHERDGYGAGYANGNK